ncbi:ATP-binding protein [Herbidospora yilanensis]|uniref:ATP-binding protein n=1 Tax=Herbidospora yilanensis TaxID=354426 RepID=UPI0007803837|nr:AAA family ATPase [Herbidospora yilanensis]
MATPAGWRRDGNLPAELTSFVGRSRLLTQIRQRIQQSRLVTVTGIGGVGKTRTALRVAHQLRSQFDDGIWYVDLARLQDPSMLHHTVRTALGLADQSSRTSGDSLADWLGDRTVLLILDTCEHMVEACAELIEDLQGRNPNLKVLATSRRSLNAAGESVIPIPPLPVPGDDPAESPYNNDAVELFRQRATAVVPDFTVEENNVTSVAELCVRLDGIPLAIELAAVRLRALSVDQILGLLTDRFSLLAGASRTALPRHQTLRAAIGWSHELCEPPERLLWARLSVFAGDFELDAARYVCAGDTLPPDRIMDVITGLVDKSVLLSYNTVSGQRYRLIDTLRQYGEEWLDKLGETDNLRRRHRDYYLQLAERGEHAWSGPRQVHWFVRMRQEHDNVRTAVDYCLSTNSEHRIGLELLSSLWFMWVACGFMREGRHYLERALGLSRQASKERCRALWTLAYVCNMQGDHDGATEAAEKCSSEALEVGDSGAVIFATKMLGTSAMLKGDFKRATALLGVAIEFHKSGRELNPGLLPAVAELALVLTYQGDYTEAETLVQDCLKICNERGELWIRSYAVWIQALIEIETDRPEQVKTSAREALRIKRHFHDVPGVLLCLETMARHAASSGEVAHAAYLLGASEHNWRASGLAQLGSPFLSDDFKRTIKECRETLGVKEFDRLFTAGQALSLEDTIAVALGELEISESL